ncbi:hypothetical protein [Nocardioides sp.]|uniref:hypothetical protein n=1 Tax=Nocardioides sp. TaxID=35761 RepID=UPI002ED2C66A
MNKTRIASAAVAAAAAVSLSAAAAQASTVERFDRSAFDSAPVVTASGYAMSAPTRGELGGHLELSVRAADGSVPAAGACENARVRAVLTVSPGEAFTITTRGELCGHPVDGSPTLNAAFRNRHVTYSGTAHRRVKVLREGLIAFNHSFLGAQGSVGMSVRW